jgi:hypothetical protein
MLDVEDATRPAGPDLEFADVSIRGEPYDMVRTGGCGVGIGLGVSKIDICSSNEEDVSASKRPSIYKSGVGAVRTCGEGKGMPLCAQCKVAKHSGYPHSSYV